MKTNTLEYFLSLDYKVQVYPDDGAFVAEIPDLPGCLTQGDTMEEAVSLINEAKQIWLETAIDKGIQIKEPKQLDEFSGKFLVRMPKSLHAKLVDQATEEGVSLNQYVVSLLSGEAEKAASNIASRTNEMSLGKASFPNFEYNVHLCDNEATG